MNQNRFKTLLGYLKPYRFHLAGAVLCAVFVSLLTAGIAYLPKPILDTVFAQKDTTMLMILPLILIGIAALRATVTYFRTYLMRYVANRIIRDLRNHLYKHLLGMPLGFYNRFTTGKLMSRILNDVSMIQTVLVAVIKDMFQQTFTMISLLAVMIYQDWSLTLMAIAVLPFAYYPIRQFSRRLKRISLQQQEKIADLTSVIQEGLSGIRIIKAFTAEGYESERFSERNKEHFNKTMKGVRVSELSPLLMEILGGVGAAIILWAGGYQVIQANMTQGELGSFLTASFLLYQPLRRLSRTNNDIQQSRAAIDRFYEVLDTPTERALENQKLPLGTIRKEIEFQGVTFYHEGSTEAALDDISFVVKAGEVIALVGSSGAGKSTLINLIPRFYQPTQGRILIDGIDISDITLDSLRGQIGIVSQETILFDDTIANNIAYGLKLQSPESLKEAATAAFAHQFIQQAPSGYQTMVGERGHRLSGGERQRLAIARALLNNPPILILDEATSNLDSESEQMIQKGLARLFVGRTTFVIAHRLSTVMNADRIFVIEQGRIKEMGPHQDLLRKGGIYKRLYDLQFKEVPRYASTK